MYTYVNSIGPHRAALEGLRRQFANNFSAFHSVDAGSTRTSIVDTGDAFVLSADVPGLSEDGIELKATASGFELQANRAPKAPEGYTLRTSERKGLSLKRQARFPTAIDPDAVVAELADGILTVTFPKAESAKARRIDVQVGG
jgi:HSP20 family protein